MFVSTSLLAVAQSDLPADKAVLSDAQNAIKTASVIRSSIMGNWMLERETGYAYTNLAKREVYMEVQNHGSTTRRSFQGFAIYQRTSPTRGWIFNRFFTKSNTQKILGASKPLEELEALTLTHMDAALHEYIGDLSGVYWVYPIEIVPGSFKQVSATEMSWQVRIRAQRRWDHRYLVERSYLRTVTAYQKIDGKSWNFDAGNDDEQEISRKEMSPSQLDKMPSAQTRGFKACYGPRS